MNIDYQLDLIATTRANFNKVLDRLSLEEINRVPQGLNNNVIWNYAHAILSTGILVYSNSNLELKFSSEWIELYKKDSKVIRDINQAEVDEIKILSSTTLTNLRMDYKNNLFKKFEVYPTSYGITLNTVEQAIEFSAIHEAVHYGYALALKRNI